jgi:hypothetical protein
VLRREQQIIQWGENIVRGEAALVLAGGTPMVNPSAAQVGTEAGNFKTNNSAQGSFKDAYDKAQEAVMKLNKEVDRVIKRVWAEIEAYYSEHSAPSRRRYGREWGIVYVGDVVLTFNFTVTDIITHAPVKKPEIVLLQTGNKRIGNAAGEGIIKSKISADQATFRFVHPEYKIKEIVIELSEGEKVFNATVELEHV